MRISSSKECVAEKSARTQSQGENPAPFDVAKLAVQAKVEERELADPTFHLKAHSQLPDVLDWFSERHVQVIPVYASATLAFTPTLTRDKPLSAVSKALSRIEERSVIVLDQILVTGHATLAGLGLTLAPKYVLGVTLATTLHWAG